MSETHCRDSKVLLFSTEAVFAPHGQCIQCKDWLHTDRMCCTKHTEPLRFFGLYCLPCGKAPISKEDPLFKIKPMWS
jgi:predicted amidophosphoribosyltransferase